MKDKYELLDEVQDLLHLARMKIIQLEDATDEPSEFQAAANSWRNAMNASKALEKFF